ncbi:MAG: (2Fe-2S) ferredoxin domain-containing protein [Pyrinomonadaceae bacterium]|nr:(2Fe-2S) ferredoxin domain-containing protein [Pyrinomonadaceae bacterium]
MSRMKKLAAHVLVCTHKTCQEQGAKKSLKELKRALKECVPEGELVLISKVKCLDQCGRGPVVAVYPAGVWYGKVDEVGARAIVKEHLCAGRVARELKILRELKTNEGA